MGCRQDALGGLMLSDELATATFLTAEMRLGPGGEFVVLAAGLETAEIPVPWQEPSCFRYLLPLAP